MAGPSASPPSVAFPLPSTARKSEPPSSACPATTSAPHYPICPAAPLPASCSASQTTPSHTHVCRIDVTIEDADGHTETRRHDRIPTLTDTGSSSAAPVGQTRWNGERGDAANPSPFPAQIHALLEKLDRTHENPAPWRPSRIESAAEDLIWLIRDGSATLAPLQHYLIYLQKLSAAFDLIARRFPKINASATSEAKDLACMATTPDEMLCISNHLYVLCSHGMCGPFTEFGCFKGFSSACLSHACAALGIEHHIFDSFAGLPPSDSGYYQPGDFAGSLDEVTRSITAFGDIAAVRFHRGYFSATLPHYKATPLAIWMDVDLRSSAEDVMQLLPRLPRESLVFSHECQPENFANGRIVSDATADHVLPPVVAAFHEAGRTPTGTYLTGCTGAVWDASYGIPPLGIAQIRRFLAAAA